MNLYRFGQQWMNNYQISHPSTVPTERSECEWARCWLSRTIGGGQCSSSCVLWAPDQLPSSSSSSSLRAAVKVWECDMHASPQQHYLHCCDGRGWEMRAYTAKQRAMVSSENLEVVVSVFCLMRRRDFPIGIGMDGRDGRAEFHHEVDVRCLVLWRMEMEDRWRDWRQKQDVYSLSEGECFETRRQDKVKWKMFIYLFN